MEFRYQVGDEIKTVQVDRKGEAYRVSIDSRTYNVRTTAIRSGELNLWVDGVQHQAFLAENGALRFISINSDTFELNQPDVRQARRGKPHHGEDNLSASMPGQVTKVLVHEGESVERGQALVILEAMKMEIKVTAPHAGRVVKVVVSKGQIVDRGHTLIELAE